MGIRLECRRFQCRHPFCFKKYASADAVRKHARRVHGEWLKDLDLAYRVFKYLNPTAPKKSMTELAFCTEVDDVPEDVQKDVQEDVQEVQEKDFVLHKHLSILYNRSTEKGYVNKDINWSIGAPPSGTTDVNAAAIISELFGHSLDSLPVPQYPTVEIDAVDIDAVEI